MNTPCNNTVIFFDFLKEYNIQIPVIQRDYVQGLALTDKSKEKRDDFVKKLMNALLPDGTPCHLDFVYGGRESFGHAMVENGNAPLLPLDGQQRLTTLFLLHWILLQKNVKAAPIEDEQESLIFRSRMDVLARFTYKTRISSGRFCQKLTEMLAKPDSLLSEQIMDKYWYDHDMQSDPTVKAMMQMLSYMEEMLKSEPYCRHIHEMLENLLDTSRQCITFDVLDMEQYNLTDGLYVKMNARGKELTPFENWKASFTDMVECSFKEEKERFSYSMEHEWNDVFWKIAYQNYLNNKETNRKESPKIDDLFMNFFNNITRLFFFIIPENQTLNAEDYNTGLWSTVEGVYKDNTWCCARLFDMLDTLYEIDKANGSIKDFFSDIFSASPQKDRVCLFDDSTDLFEAACSSGNFSAGHIILFAVLSYCMKYRTFKADRHLLGYARSCRNYLYEHNYFDTANVTISPQIRVNEMAQYLRFFQAMLMDANPLVSLEKLDLKDEYTLNEKSKLAYYQNPKVSELVCKLEDLTLTYGNLSAFVSVLEKCLSDDTYCKKVADAVDAFVSADALTKAQLFVAFGYKGIEVRNCAYGKAVFLGGEYGGRSRWMVHFRKKYDSVSPLDAWMEKYVEACSKVNDLNTVIAQNVPADRKSVEYYMLKYPDIIASQVFWRDDRQKAPFYFAMMNPWNDMDMITIHSFSSRPLNNAYQTCPMANAVARKIGDRFEKYHNAGRIGYSGQSAYKNGFIINAHPHGWDRVIFAMYFGSWEWYLGQETYDCLPSSLQEKLNKQDDGHYVLCQTENQDLVEVAADFINSVIDYFESENILC